MTLQTIIDAISVRCGEARMVIVALSGGVDSSLVAAAAHEALAGRCIAVTVRSELTPMRDFTRAVEMAEHIGIEHHPLIVKVLDIDGVQGNQGDRCYHCKRAIFDLMVLEYGDDCIILDGTNSDDDPARPGLRAVREFGVFSPLLEVGLVKKQVRETAKGIGLPNWNTPSESCLATRISKGNTLTKEGLERVETMETFFHKLGVDSLRVYHDNLMATVVYLSQYADIMDENHDSFAALIKKIGLRSFIFKEWSSES